MTSEWKLVRTFLSTDLHSLSQSYFSLTENGCTFCLAVRRGARNAFSPRPQRTVTEYVLKTKFGEWLSIGMASCGSTFETFSPFDTFAVSSGDREQFSIFVRTKRDRTFNQVYYSAQSNESPIRTKYEAQHTSFGESLYSSNICRYMSLIVEASANVRLYIRLKIETRFDFDLTIKANCNAPSWPEEINSVSIASLAGTFTVTAIWISELQSLPLYSL